MREYIKSLIFKPTLFSILGLVIVVIGIPGGLYGLTLKGGASLGGALILTGVFVTLIILVIDRFFASSIKLSTLSTVELILAVLAILFYSYSNKKIIIELNDYQEDYFVLILNESILKESNLAYSFPFNKSLTPKIKHGVISMELKDEYRIKMDNPEAWHGYSMKPNKIEGTSVRFYHTYTSNFDESKIDSLILVELKSVANITYE